MISSLEFNNIPLIIDRTGKQYLYNNKISDSSVGFFVINLIPLFIFLCNLSYLISDQLFLKIFLDLIDSFIFKDLSYI